MSSEYLGPNYTAGDVIISTEPRGRMCWCTKCLREKFGENARPTPPRPMNAFMLWARRARRQMGHLNPGTHNGVLSKMLGAEWKAMDETQKQPYREMAEEMRQAYLRLYPTTCKRARSGRKTMHAASSLQDFTQWFPPSPPQQHGQFLHPYSKPVSLPSIDRFFSAEDVTMQPAEGSPQSVDEDLTQEMVHFYLRDESDINPDEFHRYLQDAPQPGTSNSFVEATSFIDEICASLEAIDQP